MMSLLNARLHRRHQSGSCELEGPNDRRSLREHLAIEVNVAIVGIAPADQDERGRRPTTSKELGSHSAHTRHQIAARLWREKHGIRIPRCARGDEFPKALSHRWFTILD